MTLLKLLKINKWVGGERILKDISLEIVEGEFIAIIGPSGSGKSSLLYIMGFLDCPSSGDILYRGKPINFAEANTISRLRNEKMGFVFQFHYLIPELNLIENVMAPQIRKGISPKEAKERAETLLVRLGLKGKEKRQVFEISGGEMQRVAIARALANSPEILLCDEPTGNLDSKNTEKVMEIFEEINQEGTTIVLVTHDLSLARRAKRIIEMRDGEILKTTPLNGAL
ncbi:ABC transporter ATP-binding protein [Caldimicrobium thiodismutans]|uniref:ABC transporter ATP-binding protein n=1 Tax=Caldimicrobium thiodismutans TaxID=1653476 RepID=A0A0U5AFV3_9BACT|nr:ABC transporter ATP-binding protein [Caldimicrobium thiodismutans]BAU22887.1 ABC transporter ATP-binding protein [Caldimicrobium thiodismutans]